MGDISGRKFSDKTVLKRQQCCQIHIPLALVCRGKEKVKKYAETTRFVLSNDSRLHETEVFRGRQIQEEKQQTTQIIPHNALSKTPRPSFFALGCHCGGNEGEELFGS